MTLLDALLAVPVSIVTFVLQVVTAPYLIAIFGVFLAVVAFIRVPFALMARRYRLLHVAACIAALWLGVALIIWAGSSAEGATWVAR